MDNIIFEKVWEDECMIEIKVIAISKYATANQKFYITIEKLDEIVTQIKNYKDDFTKSLYIETGSKTGKYTPAFSMYIMPCDMLGKINIEVDIEIDDIRNRTHRCIYYVQSYLGSLEMFNNNLSTFYYSDIGARISLHPTD